jgi:hypothetical protein
MICPIMSKPILNNYKNIDVSELHKVTCKKEECALWIKEKMIWVGMSTSKKIEAHCGLII